MNSYNVTNIVFNIFILTNFKNWTCVKVVSGGHSLYYMFTLNFNKNNIVRGPSLLIALRLFFIYLNLPILLDVILVHTIVKWQTCMTNETILWSFRNKNDSVLLIRIVFTISFAISLWLNGLFERENVSINSNLF